jgi:hypothetical protein
MASLERRAGLGTVAREAASRRQLRGWQVPDLEAGLGRPHDWDRVIHEASMLRAR